MIHCFAQFDIAYQHTYRHMYAPLQSTNSPAVDTKFNFELCTQELLVNQNEFASVYFFKKKKKRRWHLCVLPLEDLMSHMHVGGPYRGRADYILCTTRLISVDGKIRPLFH